MKTMLQNHLPADHNYYIQPARTWDPEQMRRIRTHPCFSEDACHKFGRMHLPVAPRCNIRCNYCIRKFDCVNESRPGVSSQILKPQQALERVREVMAVIPNITVVAVAGPGDPLDNEETFETFRLVRRAFPHVKLCVSTNGLLLAERVGELSDMNVHTLTVTLNAVDPDIGCQVVNHVNYRGKRYFGREGATLLLENQLDGIVKAVQCKILVKINTVLIPTINDAHIEEIAQVAGDMGAYIQNVIPLIPQYRLAHIAPPTREDKERVQFLCGAYIRQMLHCRRCRSDAIGKIGEDVQDRFARQDIL